MGTTKKYSYKQPHLGIIAFIYVMLFMIGLSFVSSFSPPYFPQPMAPAYEIVKYFQEHPYEVKMCAFFQFCSAIFLGVFTAVVVGMLGRLNKSGSSISLINIALFGGFFNAFSLALSSMILWVMALAGIAENADIILTLYYHMFIIGGVGYSVPMGLLIAGIVIASWSKKILPRWLSIAGILPAATGLLSNFYLIFAPFLYLIPLTRFPGFVWLVLAGGKISSKFVERHNNNELISK